MPDTPDLTRRRLLAGVPLGGAALALQATPAEARVQQDAPPDPRQPQFKANDRVKTFYALARD